MGEGNETGQMSTSQKKALQSSGSGIGALRNVDDLGKDQEEDYEDDGAFEENNDSDMEF